MSTRNAALITQSALAGCRCLLPGHFSVFEGNYSLPETVLLQLQKILVKAIGFYSTHMLVVQVKEVGLD